MLRPDIVDTGRCGILCRLGSYQIGRPATNYLPTAFSLRLLPSSTRDRKNFRRVRDICVVELDWARYDRYVLQKVGASVWQSLAFMVGPGITSYAQ